MILRLGRRFVSPFPVLACVSHQIPGETVPVPAAALGGERAAARAGFAPGPG